MTHCCLVLLSILFGSCYLQLTDSAPISKDNTVGAFYYLSNYGYIPKDENRETAALMSEEVITKAVKDFQVVLRIFGFPIQSESIVSFFLHP